MGEGGLPQWTDWMNEGYAMKRESERVGGAEGERRGEGDNCEFMFVYLDLNIAGFYVRLFVCIVLMPVICYRFVIFKLLCLNYILFPISFGKKNFFCSLSIFLLYIIIC